jgi:septal ring factor EnvC (AmiA/AmiB activator)
MRGRLAIWLALGFIALVGVVPAIGQRLDGKARTRVSAGAVKSSKKAPTPASRVVKPTPGARRHPSKGLKQVKPSVAPRRDVKGEPQRLPGNPKGEAQRPQGNLKGEPQKLQGNLKGEQERLQETQNRLKAERDKAARARRREGSVLAELEEVGRRLASKQREVAQLDAGVRRVQGELAAVQRDIATLEARRSGQEALLAQRLRAIYKVEVQGGMVPVLLSGQDPVARATAVRHLTSLAALDARIIEEYRRTSEQLAERRSRGEERERELGGLRVAARREQAEVDREAARRRVLLAKVRDERAHHERMVGDLTEASQRLEALIRELQARQRQAARVVPPRPSPSPGVTPPAGGGPPPAGGGSPPAGGGPSTAAVVPAAARGRLIWPTAGRITAAFGAQVHPRFGTRTYRNGVDIEAAEGTGVDAVLAGQVVYTGWFKGYGNLIILDHGDELFTLYAHVSEIHVKEGDSVRQGQRIGSVGDTGSLAGPRLYFEVRYRGKPQDPEQWLRQRG